MSIAGLRPWAALCVLVVVGGCTSLSSPGDGSNDYTGWLLGHPGGDAAPPAQPPANAGVPAAQPLPPANAPMAQPVPPGNVFMAPPAPPGNVPMAQPLPPANAPMAQPAPPGNGLMAQPVPAAGGEVGPMIPGPAAQPNWHGTSAAPASGIIPVGAEFTGGPPPTAPPDLPPPTSSMSIVGVKPEAEEEKKKGFELSDFDPANVWKNIRYVTGHAPDEKIARAAMQEGITLFRARKYAEAADKFAIAADRWPDTPMEEDALFFQGESEFFSDQYSKAHDTYGGLLKKYPNGRYLDKVTAREFAIGRYWEQCYNAHPTWPTTPNWTDHSRPMFDTFGWTIDAYSRVAVNDPSGPLADAAKMALGNVHFRDDNFEAAAEDYDSLIKSYPNSKYQMTAHILDLQSKMRIYQGADYDETPLKDAKKIAQQSLSQFGKRLGKDEARTRQAYARIVEEQANREFQVAKYYERRSCYGAARFYYKCLISDFPTSQKAKEAKEQIEKIRTLPDEPPKYFAWLTDMLQSDKR